MTWMQVGGSDFNIKDGKVVNDTSAQKDVNVTFSLKVRVFFVLSLQDNRLVLLMMRADDYVQKDVIVAFFKSSRSFLSFSHFKTTGQFF